MIEPDYVLLEMNGCNLTITQVLDMADSYMRDHPGFEVFLDGDRRALLARRNFA